MRLGRSGAVDVQEKHDWLLTAIVIGSVLLVTSTMLRTSPYELRLVAIAGAYAIAGLGLRLQLGDLNEFNLGFSALFGIGAYTFAIICKETGLPPTVALCAAALLSAVASLVVHALTLRLTGPYLAVATLGLLVVLDALVHAADRWTGGVDGLGQFGGGAAARVPGLESGSPVAITIAIWVVVAAAVTACLWLVGARFGSALQAARQDPLLLSSLGFDLAAYRLTTAAIAGLLGGLGGGVYAWFEGYIAPSLFGLPILGMFIVMVVLGGARSNGGVILAAVVLTVAPEYARSAENYRLMVYAGVLIIMLHLAPNGLGPWLGRQLGRIVRRRPRGVAPSTSSEPNDRPEPAQVVVAVGGGADAS